MQTLKHNDVVKIPGSEPFDMIRVSTLACYMFRAHINGVRFSDPIAFVPVGPLFGELAQETKAGATNGQ
jgi:hypothetical protein